MTQQFTSGWLRDKLDERDYKYTLRVKAPTTMLPSVDLRPKCPPILDQGNLGSCTACATTSMVQFVRNIEKFQDFQPSPLFTYYSTRLMEGTEQQDAGASVRDALLSTVKYGVVPELFWRYNIKNFTVKPPAGVWNEALKHQTLSYIRLNSTSVQDICSCLSQGYPFTVGIEVFESFMTSTVARTGIVPMPNVKKENVLGGHCMMAVGYEGVGTNQNLILQNSWGTKWGQRGFCKIPFAYITNPDWAGDFWTIRITEN